MSIYNKVVWSEGLFLRPQHFQQQDRYFERYVETRCQALIPHSWGFTSLELEPDLLSIGKFGLRALAQSMARELQPKGIHVAHVIIDGQIESDRPGRSVAERGADAVLSPAAIAECYYQLHLQPPSAWTLELDVRPYVEKF